MKPMSVKPVNPMRRRRRSRAPMRFPLCGVCYARMPDRGQLCSQCAKSFDRARRSDDGTVLAAMLWAASRARRFALRSKGAT